VRIQLGCIMSAKENKPGQGGTYQYKLVTKRRVQCIRRMSKDMSGALLVINANAIIDFQKDEV
jgi:hypothetical protein